MSWLALSFFLTLGYYPIGGVALYSPPTTVINDAGMFYQQFEVEAKVFDHITLGGSVRVEDWISKPEEGIGFWPNSLASKVWVEARLGPIVVGFSHLCIHPVMPYQAYLGYDSLLDAGREELYVRIGGTIGH
jgi:hypothetical protein